jgi:hypothetical protein
MASTKHVSGQSRWQTVFTTMVDSLGARERSIFDLFSLHKGSLIDGSG